jgi:hypothetical protein
MDWRRFAQKLRYRYKRYLAIAFASVGTALLAADYICVFFQSSGGFGVGSMLSLVMDLLLLAAYIMVLVGNVKGTNLAFSGLLAFVFYVAWDFAEALIFGGLGDLSLVFSGDVASVLLGSLFLAFAVFSLVCGIMTYLRVRQYLTGRYVRYEGMRNWCLAFAICVCLAVGLEPAYLIVSSQNLNLVLAFLSAFGEVAMSWACYFTVLRLKSES